MLKTAAETKPRAFRYRAPSCALRPALGREAAATSINAGKEPVAPPAPPIATVASEERAAMANVKASSASTAASVVTDKSATWVIAAFPLH